MTLLNSRRRHSTTTTTATDCLVAATLLWKFSLGETVGSLAQVSCINSALSGPPATIKHAATNPPLPPTTERRIEIQRTRSLIMKSLDLRQLPSAPQGGVSSETNNAFICGHVSLMGRRRVMEDVVAVTPPGWLAGEYAFFAVYDGHGGARVAETCSEGLHKCLEKHIERARKLPEEGSFEWEKVLRGCFCEIDNLIGEEEVLVRERMEERMTGSTAVVVLLGKEEVVVANCGDSRAVLCRGGAVVPLSSDHKPDRPDEKHRIEASGGRIINWNGWRVEGVLATSRSLGDHYLKPWVTSEPEVTVTRLTELDLFLIIATDGLWDVISNELACEVVKKCLSGQLRMHSSDGSRASDAAATLAELAIAKGSRDNISIIVVPLK